VTKPSIIKHYSRRSFLETSASLAVGAGLFPSLLYAHRGKNGPKEISDSPRHITLLHTSDIHGQVRVHDEFFWEDNNLVFRKRGGFAHLKKMISELRKQNPNTLLFDCGDCFQGSAIAALSKGEAMIPLLNNLGYDVMLPGNWEVVYGKKKLVSNMGACKAAKVCSNMYHEKTTEFIFPPYQICLVGHIKIGVIGFTDPNTPLRQSPAYSYGIRFSEPEKNMAEYINMLEKTEHCDLIIALTHLGMAQQIRLSNQSYAKGLSYILGGDTHERIRTPIEGKFAKVMEPGAFASFIGKLDLIIEGGEIKKEAYQLLEVDPEKYEADEEMLELVHKAYQPYHKEITKTIGKSNTPLYRYFILETPEDNLITDALIWRAKPDIALSNGFRFCPPLVPDKKTGVAEITKEYLWNMLPVNAEIKMGEVTGQQLRDWLEKEIESVFSKDATKHFGAWLIRFQGMKIKFKIQDDFGKRLQEITINGKEVDPKKTYTILACEREGDPENILCRIKNVKNNRTLGYSLHSVIEEYLEAHPTVSPGIEGRAVATDAPATLLTQWTGTNYEFR